MYHVKPVFKYNNLTYHNPTYNNPMNNPIDKGSFKHATCLLTISVGQEVHEDEKFAATVQLVNASFASCILLIDCSLQRHSIALDKTQDADFFYEYSVLAGDLWLERNKKHYQNLSILKEIIRWDTWLQHPNYVEQKNKILSLIAEDATYKECFDRTIDEFLRRFYARLFENDINRERTRSLCLDYLIEECTALCLWTELGAHFEVYPAKRNEVMQETHKRFVQPLYPELVQAVSIKFKGRRQLKAQNFHSTETTTED